MKKMSRRFFLYLVIFFASCHSTLSKRDKIEIRYRWDAIIAINELRADSICHNIGSTSHYHFAKIMFFDYCKFHKMSGRYLEVNLDNLVFYDEYKAGRKRSVENSLLSKDVITFDDGSTEKVIYRDDNLFVITSGKGYFDVYVNNHNTVLPNSILIEYAEIAQKLNGDSTKLCPR
jgi:hypothetical protein